MITMIEGNSADFDVTVSLDGDPYDVTDHKIWFTIKHDFTDADVDAVLQVTTEDSIDITDGSAGEITISITPSQALGLPVNETLEADIQVRTPAGKVYTVLFEQVIVVPRVTLAQNF